MQEASAEASLFFFICRQGMDLESNWGGNEGKKGCLLRMRRARERSNGSN